MRPSLLALLAPLAGLLALVRASGDVDVSVNFPEDNAFGKVQNGVSTNALKVKATNQGSDEIVITSVFGGFYESGGKGRALRNTTVLPLKIPLLAGAATPEMSYTFHSENRIGEVGLRVWISYLDSKNRRQVVEGYDSLVTVVEPDSSFFDPQVILLYLLLLGALGSFAYMLYQAYFPPPKPTKRVVVTKVETQEDLSEWIPKNAAIRKRNPGGATSGEESGAETPGGRRKGKK